MFRAAPTPDEWATARDLIAEFLAERLADPDEAVIDVTTDRETPGRWYVRMRGEARDVTTVWLTLGQRNLHHETYVLPAAEEHQAEVHEMLLRQHHQLAGARFSIGPEDALFLVGEIGLHHIDEFELDQLLGRVYSTIERHFGTLVRLAFASRFEAQAKVEPGADE